MNPQDFNQVPPQAYQPQQPPQPIQPIQPMQVPPQNIPPVLPPVPPAQYMPAFQQPEPKKRHRILKLLIILIILAVLAVGGAYAVLAFVIKPESALTNAFGKLVETAKIHSNFNLDITSTKQNDPLASLDVTTDLDQSDASDRKTQAVISLDYPMLSGTLEIRFIDNTIYGRVITFPDYVKAQAETIGYGWYSLSLDAAKNLSGEYVDTSAAPQLTIDKAYQALMDSGLIASVRFTGVSYGDSGIVRNYAMTINKEALLEGADKAEGVVKGNNTYLEAGRAILNSLDVSEILISTSLMGSLRSVSFSAQSTSQSGYGLKVKSSYDDTMSDMNIEKPEKATSIDAAIAASQATAKNRGADAAIQARISSARVAAEVYYDKSASYAGVCTNSKDMAPILAEISKTMPNPYCKSTAQAYAISSALNETGVTGLPIYWCADSTGYNARVSKTPAGTSCTK